MEKYNDLIEQFLERYYIYHYIKLSKYWILFGNKKEIPNSGLKIHISSNNTLYFETLEYLVPILHKYNLIWKIPNSNNVAEYIMNEKKELNITGKLITIYPRNFNEFKRIIGLLENKEILNKECINIKTDLRHKNSCIFYRKY